MKEYIKELRKYVGHRPIIMCGASVIIFNEAGQVLMLQRTDNGCWTFPGGALEPGESLKQAAEREVFEETNLRLGELTLFDVFSGKELYYRYPNGDEVYNVDTVFFARQFEGELRMNDESRRAAFFDVDALPDEISPPVIPVVNAFKRILSGNRIES